MLFVSKYYVIEPIESKYAHHFCFIMFHDIFAKCETKTSTFNEQKLFYATVFLYIILYIIIA